MGSYTRSPWALFIVPMGSIYGPDGLYIRLDEENEPTDRAELNDPRLDGENQLTEMVKLNDVRLGEENELTGRVNLNDLRLDEENKLIDRSRL